jgi:inner membrane protein
MCSPVGHALAAWAVVRVAGRRPGAAPPAAGARTGFRLAAAAALSVAPDLDFLPGLLAGDANRFHHGPTHSLAFCAAAALAAAGWARARGRNPLSAGVLALAVLGSHLALDFFSADRAAPYGMPLLWPLSGAHFLSPVTVFPDVVRSAAGGEFFGSLLTPHNYRTAAFEALCLGPVALAAALAGRLRGRGAA